MAFTFGRRRENPLTREETESIEPLDAADLLAELTASPPKVDELEERVRLLEERMTQQERELAKREVEIARLRRGLERLLDEAARALHEP